MIKISEDLWQRSGELESIWGKTEYAVYQVEASFFEQKSQIDIGGLFLQKEKTKKLQTWYPILEDLFSRTVTNAVSFGV